MRRPHYNKSHLPVSAPICESVRRIIKDGKVTEVAKAANMDETLLQHFAETEDQTGITVEHLDRLAGYFNFKLRNCDTIKDEPSYLDIEATAYHEAGHAVAAWCNGISLSDEKQITITWSAKELSPSGSAIDIQFDIETETFATILLAGPLAECKIRGLKTHALTGNRNCRDAVSQIRFSGDGQLGNFLQSVLTDRSPGSSEAGRNWVAELAFKCGNCGTEFAADIITSHGEADLNRISRKSPASEELSAFVAATRTLIDDESNWMRIVALGEWLHAFRFIKVMNGANALSIIEGAVS